MGDPASPQAPVNPAAISSLPMLYYGLVVVGTAAIVLVLYNLLIVKFCIEFTDQGSRQGAGAGAGPARRPGTNSSWRFRNPNTYAVSSFEYKKEGGGAQDEGGDSECAVCLSAFEEGEELRQMPRCKHSFHAPCIDMWLYSHMDCPLCRSPVTQPRLQQSEHSQVLLGTGNLV